MSAPKVLVTYFSRAGENYKVGNIEKGNTCCLAEILAEKLHADIFEIKAEETYPTEYRPMVEVSLKELKSKARPPLAQKLDSIDQYDVIAVGYPCWCGDAPMPVYTFLESYDFKGKKIAPFCTSEGTGLCAVNHITEECPGATILPGLAVKGHEAQAKSQVAHEQVEEWIAKLELK